MTYYVGDKTQRTFRIVAQSDESITSTLQQDDDELLFETEPNSNYFISVLARFTCASATPDLRLDFENGITSATWLYVATCRDKDASGLSSTPSPNSSGHLGITNISLSGTAAEMWVKVEVNFITEANGGTCHFKWGQNSSNATALVRKAGSYMLVRQIGVNPA